MKQFQKAAGKGTSRALFIYSELCPQDNPIKYELLTQAIFRKNYSAINRFGVLIATGMITSMAKNQKSAYYFYSEAAKMDIPVAKYNVAENFELGRGVGQNVDKAAKYYKELIDIGFFDAKKKLDHLYDQTVTFKEQNPDYKKWEFDYTQFEEQEILLL